MYTEEISEVNVYLPVVISPTTTHSIVLISKHGAH
jgi:hypothetical protein